MAERHIANYQRGNRSTPPHGLYCIVGRLLHSRRSLYQGGTCDEQYHRQRHGEVRRTGNGWTSATSRAPGKCHCYRRNGAGALAVGALAIGALAIGKMAIGRLALVRDISGARYRLTPLLVLLAGTRGDEEEYTSPTVPWGWLPDPRFASPLHGHPLVGDVRP
jgi:hypothetical protein